MNPRAPGVRHALSSFSSLVAWLRNHNVEEGRCCDWGAGSSVVTCYSPVRDGAWNGEWRVRPVVLRGRHFKMDWIGAEQGSLNSLCLTWSESCKDYLLIHFYGSIRGHSAAQRTQQVPAPKSLPSNIRQRGGPGTCSQSV